MGKICLSSVYLYQLVVFVHVVSSATVPPLLTSTLGGKHACIGQEVTFTCEVTGAGRLTWVIIDNVTEENTILFDLFEDSSSLSGSHHDSTGRFTASLTNFSHNDPPYSFLGNLTSNLSVETSSADDHFTIGCQDGIINDIHLNLSIADVPSPPLSIMFQVSHGIAEYSVRVQWQTPSDDGGVGISNYTLTLTSDGGALMIIDTSNTAENFHYLNYTTNYSMAVTANNCVGSSYSTFLDILEAGCSRPSAPVNGSIEEYRSTEVGALIQLHCDEGYIPSQWNTSQCTNTAWTPDPQLLHCTPQPYVPGSDCGILQFPVNVTKNVTTTTLGSTATYQCRDGLTPSDTHTTQCTSGGVWEPDPSALTCREPETCTELEDRNITHFWYVSNIEGSNLTVFCLEGYVLPDGSTQFELKCLSGGAWSPDPDDYHCVPGSSSSNTGLSSGGIVALIVVMVVVVSICTGIVVFIVIVWRRKSPKLKTKYQWTENSYVDTTVSPNFIGQYSELQPVPGSRTEFIGQYSELQAVQADVTCNGSCSARPTDPPPIPPHSPVKPHIKNLTYAEVGPHVSSKLRPLSSQTEKVEYATLWHGAVVKPLPAERLHPADQSVGLDQVLIQLQEVVPHWRDLAEAVGMDTESLERIKRHVNSDGEAMVEVVDGWLARLYPNTPTWREIADVAEQIGHHQLSQSIKQVYVTGYLPIEVTNAVPTDPIVLNAPPPPLPPRCDEDNRAAPQSPALDRGDREEQPPPIPVKSARIMPRCRPTNEE